MCFLVSIQSVPEGKVVKLCNDLTRLYHDQRIQQWPGPPGIDKQHITSRAGLRSG